MATTMTVKGQVTIPKKVRDALLDSLSHDLRTPLASIAGAASSLRALGDKMSPSERLELLSSIESSGVFSSTTSSTDTW